MGWDGRGGFGNMYTHRLYTHLHIQPSHTYAPCGSPRREARGGREEAHGGEEGLDDPLHRRRGRRRGLLGLPVWWGWWGMAFFWGGGLRSCGGGGLGGGGGGWWRGLVGPPVVGVGVFVVWGWVVDGDTMVQIYIDTSSIRMYPCNACHARRAAPCWIHKCIYIVQRRERVRLLTSACGGRGRRT